jgi:integrase
MKMGMPVPGHPGLFQTEDGFAVRVSCQVGSVTTEKRRKLDGATLAEALVVLEKLKSEAHREAIAKSRGETSMTTVLAYARRWLEELGARQANGEIAPKTVETYVNNLKTCILPLLGQLELGELTPKDVKQWLRDIAKLKTPPTRKARGKAYKQESRPYSRASLHSSWRTLRTFLTWATVEADLDRNPTRDIRWDLKGAPDAKERVWLKPDQLAALLGAARNDRDRKALPMVLVMLMGAMRPSEMSGLDRADLNLDAAAIKIERSHTRSGAKAHVGQTKTRGSRRVVHLTEEVVAELRAYLDWQDANKVKGVPILFPTKVGTRMTAASVNHILERCYRAAGLTAHVTSYALRRTTNNQVRQAAGPLVAQAMTGHVTLAMTEHYSDVDKQERLQALRTAFGSALSGTGPGQGPGAQKAPDA